MITLIITLTMLAVVLGIALAVSLRGSGSTADSDRPFRNQEGDHVYYDKSIIEKKNFHRLYPKAAARSLSRLFRKTKGQD